MTGTKTVHQKASESCIPKSGGRLKMKLMFYEYRNPHDNNDTS